MSPIRSKIARFALASGTLLCAAAAGTSPVAKAAERCDCNRPEPVQWLVAEPMPEGSPRQLFNDFLFRRFQRVAVARDVRVPAASLAATLRSIAARPDPGTLVMTLDRNDYAELTREPSNRDLLSKLSLEVANARLVTLPLHVFVPDPRVRRMPTAGRPLRLLYFTAYNVPGAALIASIERMLPQGTKIKTDDPWPNAETLAQQLWESGDDRYDLVAILDEEPSTNVARFLKEYRRLETCDRLKRQQARGDVSSSCAQLMQRACRGDALRDADRDQVRQCEGSDGPSGPLLLPIDLGGSTSVPPNQLPAPASHLMTVLIDYEGQEFYDFRTQPARPGAIAVVRDALQGASPTSDAYPLLMTNLRARRGACCAQELRRVLGDVYIAMMPLVAGNRDAHDVQASSPVGSYLLNAVLLGRDDALRSLVLYGRLREQGDEEKAAVLLQSRNLDLRASPDQFLKRLGVKRDDNVRRQFSGDPVTSYENALQEICRANSGGTSRDKALERARKLLYACIESNRVPKSMQSGRGLWSITQYDPYWQLTRIGLIESFNVDPGPGCP